jgi:titin
VLEVLEARRLLYAVNDPGDGPLDPTKGPAETSSGTITLRSAIEQVDIDVHGSVTFSGAMTISLGSKLDAISAAGVTISGGQTGSVVITGGPGFNGLVIEGGGATIANLVLGGFGKAAISLNSSNNTVQNDYVGTDASGAAAVANQYGIADTVGRNVIGTNLISGNSSVGIFLDGAVGDRVAGNFIGTDKSGTEPLPNSEGGIDIQDAAAANTIGGVTTAARNVISGNGGDGVDIVGPATSGNVVEGNFIGTDITGTAALANHVSGVQIFRGATSNKIGGLIPGTANVIAGNTAAGIAISGQGTSDNLLQGNLVGTDGSGTSAVANAGGGVSVYRGATANTVGGTVPSARNIISGNGLDAPATDITGVAISGTGTTRNVVEGNFVGTDVTGSHALGNSGDGISVYGGATANTVGGTAAGARNIISGNGFDGAATGFHGVAISGTGTTRNIVEGNFLGTDVTGRRALGNSGGGVSVFGGATTNTVGGTVAGARNIISGNGPPLATVGYAGVAISGTGTMRNVVDGDFIGTDVTGTHALGNSGDGVSVYGGASANAIGGAGAPFRDLISGNRFSGVHISGAGTSGNFVSGDWIGTNLTAKAAVGNLLDGVNIELGASGNTVGGAGNIIAFNAASGVRVGRNSLDAALDNAILNNSIFSNAALGIDTAEAARGTPPSLAAATVSGSRTTITGTVSGKARTIFRVEFFANPPGTAQGKTYLGFIQVTTNATGSASFKYSSNNRTRGLNITATATDRSVGTSEFSAPVTVKAPRR